MQEFKPKLEEFLSNHKPHKSLNQVDPGRPREHELLDKIKALRADNIRLKQELREARKKSGFRYLAKKVFG